MDANLTSLFWKGFSVISCTEIASQTLLIRLQPLPSLAMRCRHCNISCGIHDTTLRRIRELLNWRVWLDVPVRRFRCLRCGISTKKIDWLPERQRYTALLWLRVVDGVRLSLYDWAGALVALCGMLIIVAGWGRA